MVANRQHKFTLYADDVLIFLTRTLIDVVIEFSFFFFPVMRLILVNPTPCRWVVWKALVHP